MTTFISLHNIISVELSPIEPLTESNDSYIRDMIIFNDKKHKTNITLFGTKKNLELKK